LRFCEPPQEDIITKGIAIINSLKVIVFINVILIVIIQIFSLCQVERLR